MPPEVAKRHQKTPRGGGGGCTGAREISREPAQTARCRGSKRMWVVRGGIQRPKESCSISKRSPGPRLRISPPPRTPHTTKRKILDDREGRRIRNPPGEELIHPTQPGYYVFQRPPQKDNQEPTTLTCHLSRERRGTGGWGVGGEAAAQVRPTPGLQLFRYRRVRAFPRRYVKKTGTAGQRLLKPANQKNTRILRRPLLYQIELLPSKPVKTTSHLLQDKKEPHFYETYGGGIL